MRFERIRKSSFVRNTELAVAIIAFLITAWLLQHRINKTIVPSFKFLRGRSQAVQVQEIKSGNNEERYLYSFKADFNDVCAAADTELTALGYIQVFLPGQQPYMCVYKLHHQRPGEEITVRIFDVPRIVKDSTSENSQSLSPELFAHIYGDGYVLVDISHNRPQNLSRWEYLKYWCSRLFP